MPLTTESALRKDRTSAMSPMEHRHFATIADIISRTTSNRGLHIGSDDRDALARWSPISSPTNSARPTPGSTGRASCVEA